jgi:hypothetical protein
MLMRQTERGKRVGEAKREHRMSRPCRGKSRFSLDENDGADAAGAESKLLCERQI